MMNENSANPNALSSMGSPAIYAEDTARQTFIRRTYAHLAGAICALIALESALFAFVPAETMNQIAGRLLGGYGWLLVLGGYMVVSWIARSWANSSTSQGTQYAGLGLYVVAEAVLLMPLLYIGMRFDPNLPIIAAAITGITFAGLTAVVLMTRVDLASWGTYLGVAGFAAMGLIVAGIIFGFSLGIWFCGAMVALACGFILYDTSNVLHHYNTRQYVAASLALFASVVLLFWYVLRLLMMFSNND